MQGAQGMRGSHLVVMLLVVTGCTVPDKAAVPDPRLTERHGTRRDTADDQAPPLRLEHPAMVRFHMEVYLSSDQLDALV